MAKAHQQGRVLQFRSCDICGLMYAFGASDTRTRCVREITRVSRSGLIGSYTETCGGFLRYVTLTPDSSGDQHDDRAPSADRERHERDRISWDEFFAAADFFAVAIKRRQRNERERADALSGSRREYWRRAIEEAGPDAQREAAQRKWETGAKEAVGRVFGQKLIYKTPDGEYRGPNQWHKPSPSDG